MDLRKAKEERPPHDEFMELGERVLAQTLAQSGYRWIWARSLASLDIGTWFFLVLSVGIDGLRFLAGSRSYFIVVTNRRVLFLRPSMWARFPQRLAWADPTGAGQIDRIDLESPWITFRYRRPDGKLLRFNIDPECNDEGRAVVLILMTRSPTPVSGDDSELDSTFVPYADAPAGWYDDPTVPGQERWWDGSRWSGQRIRRPSTTRNCGQTPQV